MKHPSPLDEISENTYRNDSIYGVDSHFYQRNSITLQIRVSKEQANSFLIYSYHLPLSFIFPGQIRTIGTGICSPVAGASFFVSSCHRAEWRIHRFPVASETRPSESSVTSRSRFLVFK